uniref:Ring finger protein 31 n=1 Tax=Sphenodon punctatus TaxID=8508 RepID=A0A8D0HSP9_SPHPU
IFLSLGTHCRSRCSSTMMGGTRGAMVSLRLSSWRERDRVGGTRGFEVCVCVAFGGALTRLSLPSLPGLPVERPPPEPPTSAWASKPTEALPLRPHWPCAACHRLNEARAVLCVACDRPRACKTPLNPSLDLGEQPPRGRWACHTCTFENEAATVLCAVCERPRLAGRPSLPDACPCPPPALPALPPSSAAAPQSPPTCEHCTFWNKTPGRVCAICDRTSQPGGADPAPLRCEEQEKMSKKETPAGPRPLGKSLPPSQDEAEKRRQEKLREDGQRMEAEAVGVSPELVAAAVRYSGAELPLAWLSSELPAVVEAVAELATQRGQAEPGGGLGAVTVPEAHEAWVESQGDLDEAVARCLSNRRSKVSHGEEGGDIWVEAGGGLQSGLGLSNRVSPPPPQALLRRLLASLTLPSWGRAELVVSLMLEQPRDGGWELSDIVEAVRASPNRDFIRRLLSWECAVCGWALPRNKMQSLTSCECTICPDCFAQHFTIAVKEKHITDLVCPACSEPEISDEGELLSYFSTLDIQLRSCLDTEIYELFHKKLTERVLMRDPKFLWCTHCSFGFIYESEQLEAKCPQCRQSFCVRCKRQWEPQHKDLSCEEFQEWKRTNDPEYQAQGLAVYLQENGIGGCCWREAMERGGGLHCAAKCPLPECPVRRSLHGHHPRDCLFYLRDWAVPRLQCLLQDNNIGFNTEPPAGTRTAPGGGCRVMEQKETFAGLKDEPCGKETPAGYAGLCQSHYKEYLVSLINAHSLDPASLYSLEELDVVWSRHLPGGLLPQHPAEEGETYRGRLAKLMEEVPLGQKIPRRQK